MKQNLTVSHYINNPMLINGYKFDLRIYVAITSIHPLRIYLFDQGLVRFATCKYSSSDQSNKCNRYLSLSLSLSIYIYIYISSIHIWNMY